MNHGYTFPMVALTSLHPNDFCHYNRLITSSTLIDRQFSCNLRKKNSLNLKITCLSEIDVNSVTKVSKLF